MNKWKLLAIILGFITLGAFQETFRIITSDDLDIAMQRTELTVMSVIFTTLLVFGTLKLWRKGNQNKSL